MRVLLMVLALFLASCEERRESPPVKVDVKELMGVRGCPYCHDIRRPLLGPSFLEVSRRYSEEDLEMLVESILKGSRGKWGDRAMPPQKVSEEEARLMAEWILNLKSESK
ncbi:MAG: cytochrome C [Aquificae bacterium]|nr:cytochrome C [Aquificota bacterium]